MRTIRSIIPAAIRESGVEKKTIVLFTSDNGPWERFGNHAGKTPFREHKGTTFDGGHLTHEFIDAILRDRMPWVDVAQALNMTVAGIVAHQSALKNGELLKIPQSAL